MLATGWEADVEDEKTEGKKGDMESEMPKFTEKALSTLTLVKLRSICKKYHIKQGGKKGQFVENIFQRSETLYKKSKDVDKLLHYLQGKFLPNSAPLHNFYKEYFNLVDKANKHWYRVEKHHSHQKWECKLLLAMLRIAVMDSWVYVTKLEPQKWVPWRVTLSKKLMDI